MELFWSDFPAEFLFVTSGTQTETGCICNEAVGCRHCVRHTLGPLSAAAMSTSLHMAESQTNLSDEQISLEFPQMRPKCSAGCELSAICLCMQHMPSFHYLDFLYYFQFVAVTNATYSVCILNSWNIRFLYLDRHTNMMMMIVLYHHSAAS